MASQAQENPTNNVNQVNPAVFYNEDDCRDARDQASSALMVEYYARSGNLTERRKKLLKDSESIAFGEIDVIDAERRRKIDGAQMRYNIVVAAAMVALIECELAITVTGPAWYKAGDLRWQVCHSRGCR